MPTNIVTDEQIKRIRELLVVDRYSLLQNVGWHWLTASTMTEPLFFCFSRPTPKELASVVTETLVSYVENFWEGGQVVEISIGDIVDIPAPRPAPPPIPIHALAPFLRVRPTVRRVPGRELESA